MNLKHIAALGLLYGCVLVAGDLTLRRDSRRIETVEGLSSPTAASTSVAPSYSSAAKLLAPTAVPTTTTTSIPTSPPSSSKPTAKPLAPTAMPTTTSIPTGAPSSKPNGTPVAPTAIPTTTSVPTVAPSFSKPTAAPQAPTVFPTTVSVPTAVPTSSRPTAAPLAPTATPTIATSLPTSAPSSGNPTAKPSPKPSSSPKPTRVPSIAPTQFPTVNKVPPATVFDLSCWYLQLPVSSTGVDDSPLFISTSQLQTFSDRYFHMGPNNVGLVFHVPVWGVHTSGSENPRSELRETDSSGNNVYWYPNYYALSQLTVTMAVNQVPNVTVAGIATEIVIGQIKGGGTGGSTGNPIAMMQYRYTPSKKTGYVMVQVQADPISGVTTNYKFTSASNVPLNQTFSYTMALTTNLLTGCPSLSLTVNSQTSVAPLACSWNNNTVYFKAGAYLRDNSEVATGAGEVIFYSLNALHVANVNTGLELLTRSDESLTSAVLGIAFLVVGVLAAKRLVFHPRKGRKPQLSLVECLNGGIFMVSLVRAVTPLSSSPYKIMEVLPMFMSKLGDIIFLSLFILLGVFLKRNSSSGTNSSSISGLLDAQGYAIRNSGIFMMLAISCQCLFTYLTKLSEPPQAQMLAFWDVLFYFLLSIVVMRWYITIAQNATATAAGSDDVLDDDYESFFSQAMAPFKRLLKFSFKLNTLLNIRAAMQLAVTFLQGISLASSYFLLFLAFQFVVELCILSLLTFLFNASTDGIGEGGPAVIMLPRIYSDAAKGASVRYSRVSSSGDQRERDHKLSEATPLVDVMKTRSEDVTF